MKLKIVLFLILAINVRASENIWFFKSSKMQLTNKTKPDSLVIIATGDNIDSLKIAFEIWSDTIQVYSETWQSVYYFEYDSPYDELSYEYKQKRISKNLNSFFDKDAFNRFNQSPLDSWPEPSSDIYEYLENINWYSNYFYAYDSLSKTVSNIDSIKSVAIDYAFDVHEKRPETLRQWNTLSKNNPLTFTFFSGGEYTRTIAWDNLKEKFYIIWSCC